jgi:hypothetical protein
MLDEGELLGALERALGTDPEGPPAGRLVVVRRGLRRRSTIYFVGVEHDGPATTSWVVKCPSPEAERLGIRPPMTAAEQYAALERLHDFLADRHERFVAPRPVALLPEFDALAMEFVEGRSLWDLVVPSALWSPDELRDGVRDAALALRHLHTIEPAGADDIDLNEVEEAAAHDSREALRFVEARIRDTWFRPGSQVRTTGQVVLLHGDWAPENVLLDREQVFLLDPELTDRGWPEYDLARFLLMLWDRSLFVTTGALRWSTLRHELTKIFLSSYYAGEPVSLLLRPLLLREVSQRWAVRHQEAQRGSAPARRARSLLLASYFGAVLDEVSDSSWPVAAVR